MQRTWRVEALTAMKSVEETPRPLIPFFSWAVCYCFLEIALVGFVSNSPNFHVEAQISSLDMFAGDSMTYSDSMAPKSQPWSILFLQLKEGGTGRLHEACVGFGWNALKMMGIGIAEGEVCNILLMLKILMGYVPCCFPNSSSCLWSPLFLDNAFSDVPISLTSDIWTAFG